MTIIWTLIRKEFSQFFRDSSNIRMLLVMPVIQLIVLPLVADYEVKNVRLCIVDQDHSTYTFRLIEKLRANHHFIIQSAVPHFGDALKKLDKDEADVVLVIPENFEQSITLDQEPSLSACINAVNGQRASVGGQYLLQVLQDFNMELRLQWIQFPRFKPVPLLKVEYSYWFNPEMNYQHFMVPGILVILVTMVGFILSALNLVKEKEMGTIEQINVSPIKKYQFILGKLVPFWIFSQIVLSIGLLIAFVIYGIVPSGSIGLIYLFSSVYLMAILGAGLLVSTFTETQQQTMLIAFFFMMVCILLSGLYTPIESMPSWAQQFNYINPVAYFVKIMRMIIMKGSSFSDILPSLLSVAVMAIFLIAWAIRSYRKNY